MGKKDVQCVYVRSLHPTVCVNVGPEKRCVGNPDLSHCSQSAHGSLLDYPEPEKLPLQIHTHTHRHMHAKMDSDSLNFKVAASIQKSHT